MEKSVFDALPLGSGVFHMSTEHSCHYVKVEGGTGWAVADRKTGEVHRRDQPGSVNLGGDAHLNLTLVSRGPQVATAELSDTLRSAAELARRQEIELVELRAQLANKTRFLARADENLQVQKKDNLGLRQTMAEVRLQKDNAIRERDHAHREAAARQASVTVRILERSLFDATSGGMMVEVEGKIAEQIAKLQDELNAANAKLRIAAPVDILQNRITYLLEGRDRLKDERNQAQEEARSLKVQRDQYRCQAEVLSAEVTNLKKAIEVFPKNLESERQRKRAAAANERADRLEARIRELNAKLSNGITDLPDISTVRGASVAAGGWCSPIEYKTLGGASVFIAAAPAPKARPLELDERFDGLKVSDLRALGLKLTIAP